MRLGVRAHDFGKLPVEELAAAIAAKGFTSIQLALAKAIPNIDTSLGRLSPGLANYIGETFHKHGIHIAVLGCYINPVHPDPDERRKVLARFKEHIRMARDFGCSIVATETGSANADCSFHPDNPSPKMLQELIGNVAQLVEEAEKFGVFVCIEGVTHHTMSTPQKIRQVLEAIDSPNLQVLFDPVNLTPADNPQSYQTILQESLELFGDRIFVLHAKDFAIENGSKKTVPIGRGLMDWEYVLKEILRQKPYLEILVEDNKPDTIMESAGHIQNVLTKLAIR
ncbi:MAG TPA: sugar phosphate isomerase/epimerase family protein [Bacillota bacterium]|nr:sugar phosphate isomerase/epimerase family protein [Bacillota bacterium]HPT88532.1 sugar phosphate isomerase/epimerase family protein [Bacillota bacterium]